MALLFSMCSIGALYRFEEEQAVILHTISAELLSEAQALKPFKSKVFCRSSVLSQRVQICLRPQSKLSFYVFAFPSGAGIEGYFASVWVYTPFSGTYFPHSNSVPAIHYYSTGEEP
jgi:hypothetical protein